MRDRAWLKRPTADVVGGLELWHNADMPLMRYTVQLGARGRLVLPAPLRRALGLEEGAQLVLEAEGETVRLVKATEVAQAARGLFQRDAPDRDLASELLAERREEAARESGTPTAH
jgi:AbrB family looped-hinge helix DNA binding protein